MSRNLWIAGATAMCLGGAVIGAAQTQDRQDQPTSPAATSSAAITITGCLQRSEPAGPPASAAASPSAAPAPSPQQFVLMNAMPSRPVDAQAGAAAPGSAAGALGTNSGRAAGTSGTNTERAVNYVIEGSRVELSTHVGHRVEVTGKVVPSPAVPAGSVADSAAPAPGTPAANPNEKSAPYEAHRPPHFEVASLRMVSQGCDGQ